MWEMHSHTLAPLTKTTPGKVKFKGTKTKQEEFKEIKRIVAHNVLLYYPEIIKQFKIHTNDIRSQLGVVIIQEGEPITFYIRKLTDNQKRYTVTEKELLIISKTLD